MTFLFGPISKKLGLIFASPPPKFGLVKCVEFPSLHSGPATLGISGIGAMLSLKPELRHFAYPSPNFHRGGGEIVKFSDFCENSLPVKSKMAGDAQIVRIEIAITSPRIVRFHSSLVPSLIK